MGSINANGSWQGERWIQGDSGNGNLHAWTLAVWARPRWIQEATGRVFVQAILVDGGAEVFSANLATDEGNPHHIRLGLFSGDQAGTIPLSGEGGVDTDAPEWVRVYISCSGAASPGSDWSGDVRFRWVVDGVCYDATSTVPYTDVRLVTVKLGGPYPDALFRGARVFSGELSDADAVADAANTTGATLDTGTLLYDWPLESNATSDVELVGGRSLSVSGTATDSEEEPPGWGAPEEPDIGTPLSAAVWMVTGHSLTDGLSTRVADLADDAALDQDWQAQHIVGSPIRVRTGGDGISDPEEWSGYATGTNRSGSDLDLVAHFRNVTAAGGKETVDQYTALVIAERHDLFETLQWEATAQLARHYYELIREGSPSCVGYLYATWLEYANVTLEEWIDHLREAQSATAAIASRINLSLAHEERSDRLMCIPSALALANVLDASTGGNTLAGITQETDEDTVALLFADAVHPSAVGWYLLGCVTYGALYRRDPRGLAYPEGVTEEQAESLQQVAWDTLVEYFDGAPLGEQYDQSGLKTAFVDYLELALQIRDESDQLAGLTSYYSGTESPLHFDAETDGAFWFAPPEDDEEPGEEHAIEFTASTVASASAAVTVAHPVQLTASAEARATAGVTVAHAMTCSFAAVAAMTVAMASPSTEPLQLRATLRIPLLTARLEGLMSRFITGRAGVTLAPLVFTIAAQRGFPSFELEQCAITMRFTTQTGKWKFDLTIDDGLNVSGNIVTASVSKERMAALGRGLFNWVLIVELPDGSSFEPASGTLQISGAAPSPAN